MRSLLRPVLVSLLCLTSLPAGAALIHYTVSGSLEMSYGTDDFGLDGAQFSVVYVVDDGDSPTYFSLGPWSVLSGFTHHLDPLPAMYSISGRQGGLSDFSVETYFNGFTAQNAFDPTGYPDSFSFDGTQLIQVPELSNRLAYLNGLTLRLWALDFFPDSDPVLSPPILTTSDVMEFMAGGIFVGDAAGGFDVAKVSYFQLTNSSVSVSAPHTVSEPESFGLFAISIALLGLHVKGRRGWERKS